ncbi:hypothetical protein [Ornithinimicrobium cerasi]|uniref:Integral membrane protein n=1 Tax=Ornithinimicrobium cerasi TaxID=2248773 RepID=A0A285VGK5_9MICO|nr:hypothetical protein [Ornithinimicrobium cerasi]SOC52266.1 hypothetical protein SAMN05421879_101469 [Ornithinimicrobium cerasi]
MRTAVGVLAIALGLLWTLQGLGVVGGSPMTGVTLWAVVGPIVALAGVALILTGRRGRP